MKFLFTSIVLGPLMLFGALPAVAGQPTPAPRSGTPTRLAADDSTTDRDTYAHRAQADMQEWQRKLHRVGETTEAKGREAGNTAENDLNEVWTRAEAASRKLQAVAADDWESAKASFERASHELTDTWHKTHSEDR
jgi:hypothetical protein